MPTLAYPVSELIERLQGAELIKFVGLTDELSQALEKVPRTTPSVFIMTESKGGAMQFSSTPVTQARETSFKLFVWLRHQGTPEKARAEMDAVLACIDQRLAGFTPGNAFSELRFIASRDEFAQPQFQVVQVIYQCDWSFFASPEP